MKLVFFSIVTLIFNLYIWAVLLKILLQFVRADYFNPLSQAVIKVTQYPCKMLNKIIPRHSIVDTGAVVLLLITIVVKVILLIAASDASITILGVMTAAFTDLILQILNLYFFMIVIVVFASWVAAKHYNPVLMLIDKLTNPVLSYARKIIPPFKGLDFSPILVLVLIKLIEYALLMPLLHFNGMA